MMSVIANLGLALLVLAGLLLPGTIWARAAGWPLPWLAGGVISALGLFSGVIVLGVSGAGVTAVTLGGWQAALAAAGIVFQLRRRSVPVATGPGPAEWWVALPALPMVAVTAWRAVMQPLPGADVDFRWNYLAEAIVNTGSLAHYPPFTATDFAHYFWPDGIAPLVASIYAWTYLAAGSTAKTWTALPVLLQFAGLLALLLALGRLWAGRERGGWFALALGGATMLLQFSLNLGQETGLTTLGVGGLAYYLVEWQRTPRTGLLVPAAACAALAASAREYGLIFPLVGAAWVLAARGGWRAVWFALGALALPGAWHLRNWLRTGNPFYAQEVAGIFPVNPVFADWMRGYRAIHGAPLQQWSGWLEVGRIIVLTALPAWLGLLAGTALWRRQPGWAGTLGLAGATLGCWLVSVPYTAGGLFYSMRVLGPLLLLGCAWGGAALAQWVPGNRHLAGVLVALGLFAGDASLRAWTIPLNPYAIAPREWPEAGYLYQREFARDDLAFLQAIAREVPGKVLSDSAGVQEIFLAQGKSLVPLWSPETAFVCAADFTGDAAGRLRELGYSHLLIKRAQFSADFLRRTGATQRLRGRVRVVRQNQTYQLLVLEAGPDQGSATPP